jgi:acyl carrier protein
MTNELKVLTDYIRDELGYDGPLDPDTDLLEEQILDSFSIVQMVVHIQDAFEIEFEPEELVRENLSRLSGMLALIEKHKV